MAQGKYAQNETFKISVKKGEYATISICERGFKVLYRGSQEACEDYARENGTAEYPLWVEHLESGYRQKIEPKIRATVLNRDDYVMFEGTPEECSEYCKKYPERYFEIWLNDWFDLNVLA